MHITITTSHSLALVLHGAESDVTLAVFYHIRITVCSQSRFEIAVVCHWGKQKYMAKLSVPGKAGKEVLDSQSTYQRQLRFDAFPIRSKVAELEIEGVFALPTHLFVR